MHTAEETHSTEEQRVESRRRKNTTPPFLQTQRDLQNEMHCDYVLLWYKRDPNSPPGQRPNYLSVREPIPVSLSHQVFMQMALGVLKDRLLKAPGRRKKTGGRTMGNGASDDFSSANNTQQTPTMSNAELEGELKNVITSREQDVVALFLFLWNYVSSMLESQANALQLARAQNKGAVAPCPTICMTKQQLRLQMLLEYGVDVQQVLGDSLPTTAATGRMYCQQYLTSSVGEEEFYNQLAKPSGMAQECSIM